MRLRALFLTLVALSASSVVFASPDFSGTWSIDLRSPSEKKAKAECGSASFVLSQSGEKITGSHTFYTVGCGRMNEGGEGTVKGVVIGSKAALVVTSARNNAIVLGTAKLQNGLLHWRVIEVIQAERHDGDSPLILDHGILKPKRP